MFVQYTSTQLSPEKKIKNHIHLLQIKVCFRVQDENIYCNFMKLDFCLGIISNVIYKSGSNFFQLFQLVKSFHLIKLVKLFDLIKLIDLIFSSFSESEENMIKIGTGGYNPSQKILVQKLN